MSNKKKVETIVVGVTKARNFIAKNAGINRAATHVDKKKQLETPRKLKNLEY